MLPHKNFCARCGPVMCSSRTGLRNSFVFLQPNYSLIEIEKFRKKRPLAKIRKFELGIKYSGEYLARPLPSGGLDLIYNHRDGAMLSDQADFNFHNHGFEIAETIRFDHQAPVEIVPCPLKTDSKFFIGDIRLLTIRSTTHTYSTVGGFFFNPVYMDDELIGYSISERLWGYDAVNGKMYSDDGFNHEMILRYTDTATKTVDGIMFAGLQNENFMNFQEGVDDAIQWCAECSRANR